MVNNELVKKDLENKQLGNKRLGNDIVKILLSTALIGGAVLFGLNILYNNIISSNISETFYSNNAVKMSSPNNENFRVSEDNKPLFVFDTDQKNSIKENNLATTTTYDGKTEIRLHKLGKNPTDEISFSESTTGKQIQNYTMTESKVYNPELGQFEEDKTNVLHLESGDSTFPLIYRVLLDDPIKFSEYKWLNFSWKIITNDIKSMPIGTEKDFPIWIQVGYIEGKTEKKWIETGKFIKLVYDSKEEIGSYWDSKYKLKGTYKKSLFKKKFTRKIKMKDAVVCNDEKYNAAETNKLDGWARISVNIEELFGKIYPGVDNINFIALGSNTNYNKGSKATVEFRDIGAGFEADNFSIKVNKFTKY